VLPHLPKLISRINYTAKKIIEEKPDYVITIDSPDFNFRVMKKIKNFKDTKKIHLIAPSVWAYREGRAQKISKLYDLLLAILPFEPPYFEKYNLKTIFIGHPIIEDTPDFNKKEESNLVFRKKYQINQDEKIICIMPGSRNSEVEKIFPEFILAINLIKNNKIKVVIPVVAKTKKLVEKLAKNLEVKYFLIEKEEKKLALFSSDFALAKSGTNTIELSLYKIPMIVAYKINALTHFIVKRMVKIQFANLVNLISNCEIIPEMLQKKCEGKKIAKILQQLMDDKNLAQKQITESQQALELMGLSSKENSSQKAAREILKL
jgi:lipid-A-disaccharide synthase